MPRWLADLGRPEPALTAIEDAVRVYRDLAQARPDAFLPDLAQAMTTLGIHLTDLANYDKALATDRHVVKLYLRLIASDPERYADSGGRPASSGAHPAR